jgi:hypothetical protein
LRTISTANTTYSSVYGIGYALELSKLGPAAGSVDSDSADLLDSALAITQQKSGYSFATYTNDGSAGTRAEPVNQYTLVATPTGPESTGVSTFCVDATTVIRKEASGTVLAADGPGLICDPGDGSVFPPL